MQHSGFTFTEVLMAALVIGIAIFPVFMVFSRGSTGTIQTRDEVTANALAAELLAFSQSLPYDDPFLKVQAQTPVPRLPLPNVGGKPLNQPIDSRFSRLLTVKEVACGAEVPYAYKVLLGEVSWKSSGIDRKLGMTGMIYRGKP